MLRHVPVGLEASCHFQYELSKLPLSSQPVEHRRSLTIERRHKFGGIFIPHLQQHRHNCQSSIVAMAISPPSVETARSTDASTASKLGEVVVAGAGPAGCLLAHYLLRRGYFVHLFEKRVGAPPLQPEENRSETQVYARADLRSYTILLTSRAIRALEGAGLKLPPNLLNLLEGSCIHQPDGKMRKFNYSNEPGLVSFGVSRNALVAWLQQSLYDRYPNLKTYFEYELKSVDTSKNTASFARCSKDFFSTKPETVDIEYDLLVGADGVNSAVRSELIRSENSFTEKKTKPVTFEFKPSVDSYKSFYVRPEVARKSALYEHHNRVQSWPALNILLTGMADGSFWGGSKNEQLLSASSVHEVEILFREKSPEVFELLQESDPNFSENFLKQPAISFGGAVTLSRFHHGNILVIGDAAHAMFPSYGTGCNVALEDCLLLDQILQEFTSSGSGSISFDKVVEEFTKRRVEDAHAIVEMNTTMELFPRGFLAILQTMLLTSLHKLAPALFKPIAYQQLWSDTPFRQIQVQKRNEDTLFYGLLLVVGLLVIAALLFAFGIQPKLRLKSF